MGIGCSIFGVYVSSVSDIYYSRSCVCTLPYLFIYCKSSYPADLHGHFCTKNVEIFKSTWSIAFSDDMCFRITSDRSCIWYRRHLVPSIILYKCQVLMAWSWKDWWQISALLCRLLCLGWWLCPSAVPQWKLPGPGVHPGRTERWTGGISGGRRVRWQSLLCPSLLIAFPALSPNFRSKHWHTGNMLKWKTFCALHLNMEIHLGASIKHWSYILCTSKGAAGICARADWKHKSDWHCLAGW